jgi:hypothetical protein
VLNAEPGRGAADLTCELAAFGRWYREVDAEKAQPAPSVCDPLATPGPLAGPRPGRQGGPYSPLDELGAQQVLAAKLLDSAPAWARPPPH